MDSRGGSVTQWVPLAKTGPSTPEEENNSRVCVKLNKIIPHCAVKITSQLFVCLVWRAQGCWVFHSGPGVPGSRRLRAPSPHRLYTSNSWRSLSAARGWKECGARWRRPNIQVYMSAKQPLGFGTWGSTALEMLLLSSPRTVRVNPLQCEAKAQTQRSRCRVKTAARPQWTTLAVDGLFTGNNTNKAEVRLPW